MPLTDWTYSGDPASSNLDAVRFLSGDTSTGNQLVTDSEINFSLTEENSNTYRAAALVCESLAASKSKEPDMRVGDLSISGSQFADMYRLKAKDLRDRATSRQGVGIYIGGQSVDRKETRERETDRVEPFFRREDFINPAGDVGASTERT